MSVYGEEKIFGGVGQKNVSVLLFLLFFALTFDPFLMIFFLVREYAFTPWKKIVGGRGIYFVSHKFYQFYL